MAQLTASDIFTDSRDPGTNVNPKVLGSLWINYNTGEQFVCKDNTLNKNVWVSSTKVIREDLDKLEDSVSDKIDDITVTLKGGGRMLYGARIGLNPNYYPYKNHPPYSTVNIDGFELYFMTSSASYTELICYYRKTSNTTTKYTPLGGRSFNKSITINNPIVWPVYIKQLRLPDIINVELFRMCYPVSINYSGPTLTSVTLAHHDGMSLYHTGEITPLKLSTSCATVSGSIVYDASINLVSQYVIPYVKQGDIHGNGG